MLNIASLNPDQFRIDLRVKVIELVVSLKTKHEQSDVIIHIYEYLVGDDTGCIVLNTKSELQIDSVYDIEHAYTETVEGYLRLYATDIELSSSNQLDGINTQNNRSAILFARKLHH
ncbi:Small subunit processome complex component [Mucor circinelloides]